MGQVFAAFGIDWRLLLIDSVNFGLLLLALWYFLYQPLTEMLEKRRQKVAQGVRDADEAKRKLSEITSAQSAMLASAGAEADEVLRKARAAAQEKEREVLAQSQRTAASVLSEAELRAQEIKEQALRESKQEVAKLVVLGIEKMMKTRS